MQTIFLETNWNSLQKKRVANSLRKSRAVERPIAQAKIVVQCQVKFGHKTETDLIFHDYDVTNRLHSMECVFLYIS